jgi:hypothetical protein
MAFMSGGQMFARIAESVFKTRANGRALKERTMTTHDPDLAGFCPYYRLMKKRLGFWDAFEAMHRYRWALEGRRNAHSPATDPIYRRQYMHQALRDWMAYKDYARKAMNDGKNQPTA